MGRKKEWKKQKKEKRKENFPVKLHKGKKKKKCHRIARIFFTYTPLCSMGKLRHEEMCSWWDCYWPTLSIHHN